jgi:membrane dipeptidase
MKRLLSLLSSLALIAFGCGSTDKGNLTDAELIEKAKGIHERVITLDTHDDIDPENFTGETNYTQRLETQVNLPKMIEGGLDVAWFIVYVGQGELTAAGFDQAYKQADEKFKAIHRLCEEIAHDKIELALTSDDVRRISASGKKVAMIGVENGYPIGTDISRIKEFQERGARYMSLAHNGHSQLADSNTGERDSVWLHNGLSELGRQAIKEMNKWGIMIDLSHPSKAANMEMMKLSKAPVIASHSSARALNDVSRNLDDEQLMMLKENGGVVQAVAFKSYVNSKKNNAYADSSRVIIAEVAKAEGFDVLDREAIMQLADSARGEYIKKYRAISQKAKPRIEQEVNPVAPPVNVADFVDHIDYLVKKIGLEHVGISSDFDGGGGVDGWSDASETFNVTLELVRRGYTEEQIAALWSGNLLRVLDQVQEVARKIQAEEGL